MRVDRSVSPVVLLLLALVLPQLWGANLAAQEGGSPLRRPLEKVKLTVAAKSVTFVPFYFGKAKGFFKEEGVDLDIVVIRPPIGITALQAGEVDYSASSGVGMRAALKGASLRALMFIQTKLSFSLIGQPGMDSKKIKTVAVSGVGSLAHYAAIAVLKKLGRGGPNDALTYITTNTTAQSYASLMGKAVDAAILTPPYTSMATIGGYADLGNAFDMRDVQGGLVARASHLQEHREQVKAMVRAILRSLDYVVRNEAEAIRYLQKEFHLEPKVAADSYGIVKQVLNTSGDIEEPILKSVVENMKKETQVTADFPMDRIVDLTLLREVRSELQSRGRK
jgi:ABC-type nitrate/sulfonate/bicarbonate transport system substrate-binding protein